MNTEGFGRVSLMAVLSFVNWFVVGAEISDAYTIAYDEADLWLGPTEVVEGDCETEFAFVVFRELPNNSSEEDVRASVDASGAEDKGSILAHILGSSDPFSQYQEFKKWAEEIGDVAVAKSKYAWSSFIFGVEDLFVSAPEVCFTKAVATSTPVTMDVAVVVRDGNVPRPVSSVKVAEMLKVSVDIADWSVPDDRLKLRVVDNTKSVATPVEFTVRFGDVALGNVFLRLSE